MAASWAMLHAPKLVGYAEVLLKPALAARYGGRRAFLRGAAAELAFTTLLDPVSIFNKAMFLAALPFGVKPGWAPQNRADRGVGWADAARLLWPHTAFGALVLALCWRRRAGGLVGAALDGGAAAGGAALRRHRGAGLSRRRCGGGAWRRRRRNWSCSRIADMKRSGRRRVGPG